MKKLFATTLAIVVFAIVAAVQVMAQTGFAYQAVIRDSEGNLITQGEVGLQFSLMNAGKTYYVEAKKATPDQYGNISVIIGDGKNKVSGSYDDVPWNTLDITLKVEVDVKGGTNYKLLGETKINPAPYALYASKGGGAATVGGATKDGATLFEVNDRNGNPVFAVTDNGIVVYVDDTDSSDKARRSGFLIVGREDAKGESEKEYFSVTADGTQIHVDGDDSKVRRSGFYITGRESKGGQEDYLIVDSKGTTVYVDVDGDDKARRSGFYITGREDDKSAENKMFAVDGGQTTVYVDDLSNGKVRRSGFLITGRDSKDGNGVVDITGNRTNLTTSTLSIANSGVAETDAPVSAFQISEENITMNSDMAMEGGVRPALDVEEIEEVEEYKVWLSDTETDDELDDYDEINSSGYFYFDNGSGYNWLGAFHDDLVVPLSSEYSMLMFNRDGEETAIAEDAVVVVFYEYGDINVWPLAALDDFTVSFAMTDYYPTSAFSGTADEYARFDVTLNSTKPYAGCYVYLDGEIPYTAKITMPDRTFEQDVIKNEYGYSDAGFEVVFGQKVTMEATDIPTDKLFNYWFVSGRRYYSNPVTLPVMSRNTRVVAVFKDESEKLWVDGTFTSPAEPTAPIGSEENPYITIAAALDSVARNEDPRVGYRIIAQNIRDSIAIKADCNGKAKYISIDIDDSHIYQIKDSTTVPVYVRNMDLQPHNSYGGDVVQVKIKDASLTLEGCVIDGNGDLPGKMHGAYVGAGELTLINTEILDFKAEQGAGVYVASGATLTVKGNRNSMSISGNTAEQGGGIYVANGATLNVSGGQISDNRFVDEAANLAGADIYLAGDKAVFNLNPNYQGSDIGKIGLAGGAVVTAVGNYPIYERYHGEPEETQCVASFDYIENIEKPLVKLGANVHPNNLAKISQCFSVVVRDLLAEGYSSSLNSEAKLFKYNRVYATSQIGLGWGNKYTYIYYTYFRNEDNNEYLYLKYMGNDTCEYRNYWIVDGTIYGDTIYLQISETEDAQPIYNYQSAFENENRWKENWGEIFISEKYENDINLFGIQQIADGYDVGYDYGMTIFTNDGNVMAAMKDNVVVSSTMDFFKNDGNLAVFKSLIAPSVSIEGRGVDLKNITGLDWFGSGYTLVDSEATSDGIVEMENYQVEDVDAFVTEKDVHNYLGELRKQTLAEVEAMFYDLKHGFTVTLATSLGGKIINNNTDLTGDNNQITKQYGDTINLLARCDNGFVFSGWSDGVTDSIRTINVCGHQNLTAKFSKEFYVSSNSEVSDEERNGTAEKPYKSIADAVSAISNISQNYYYDIMVAGVLNEPQTISGEFISNVITIKGIATQASGISISGGTTGTALTIDASAPIVIENLKISGGNAQEKGGGIYCAPGSNVTLNAAVKVTGNKASKYGGGVYVDGTISGNDAIRGKLTMNEGSVISSNEIIDDQVDGWNGGMGVYVNCGELIMNGGEISSNNGTTLNQRGALRLENAIFKMRGGKITNNTVSHIGANIFSGGKTLIEMSGGEISNGRVESSSGVSGAIYLSSNTVMNMSGGVIKDNTASAASGIMLCSGATLNMSGGTISGNKVQSGTSEGDAIHVSGTFNISDSAYIAADNDVFLAAGKTITVTGSLTHEAPVATITPASYSEEVKVLDGDFADSQGGKFNVTKEGDKQWFIHRGYLTDKYVYDADIINGDIVIRDASIPYIICGSGKYTGQIDVHANENNKEYDITLSNINIQHYESWDWSSALILFNEVKNNKAEFKITLEGNNILYGRNHSGFKLVGVAGAESNVVFDVKPGTEATLEFKNNYAGTPCLQLLYGVTGNFSLADGCDFVGKISKAEIYSDRINKIDRENDDLFNIYDSNTYSSSQEAFNAFINDAQVKDGQVVVGQYLFIIKIERKN